MPQDVIVAWSNTMRGITDASVELAKNEIPGRWGQEGHSWSYCLWVPTEHVEAARKILESADGCEMFYLADRVDVPVAKETDEIAMVGARVALSSGLRLALWSLIFPILGPFALVQLGLSRQRGIGREGSGRYLVAGLTAFFTSLVFMGICFELYSRLVHGTSVFFR